MPERGSERRRHVRLTSRESTAGRFSGRGVQGLPEPATVVDVSEGGLRLAFPWPAGRDFPLKAGDGLGFQVRLEGTAQVLEVQSAVRRVAADAGRGGVTVGVQFAGLAPEVEEALKKAVLNLAFTKLRSAQEPVPAPRRAPRSKRAAFEPAEPAGPPVPPRKRFRQYLGEILVKQGAVEASRLKQILAGGAADKRPLGQKLAEQGLVDDIAIARALAEQAHLPYVDLIKETPDLAVAYAMPRGPFVKHRCLPVRDDGRTLLVAMAQLPSIPMIQELEGAAGRRVRAGIAPEGKLAEWLKRVYNVEGAPGRVRLRSAAAFGAEYRFLDAAGQVLRPDCRAAGTTRDLGVRELSLVGPLPETITPKRITAEGLKLEVQVECAEVLDRIVLGCRLLSVGRAERAGDHLLSCYIEQFPPGGQAVWERLCTVAGTLRFRPSRDR